MDQGFADEAVVVVKREAEEGMATCLRVKLHEKRQGVEAKGGTCWRCVEYPVLYPYEISYKSCL